MQDYRAGPRDSGRIVLFHLVSSAPALHARATTAAEGGLERVVVLILNACVCARARQGEGGVWAGARARDTCTHVNTHTSARALSTFVDAHVCAYYTLNPKT